MIFKTLNICIVLISFFILFSCETTEELEFEENNIELTIENRSSNNSSIHTEAASIISKIQKNVSSKSKNFIDEINFDDYKYIEYDNYHSYTFSFQSSTRNSLKNLLLTIRNDNSYDAFLIDYYLTDEQYDKLSNGEILENNIQGSATKLDIETGELLDNLQKSCSASVSTIGYSCVSIPSCSFGGTSHPAGPNCTAIDGATTACSPVTQIAITGCGSEADDGGSGGGGGAGVIPHPDLANPEPTVPCDSSNENQVFDNGNGSCVGVTTTPTIPIDLIEDIGNRRLLRELMDEASFQTHLEILETASSAATEKREFLYAGVTNGEGETIFSYVGQSEIGGVQVIIENPIIGQISSLFHNHYAGISNQGNLLPTFSAADVSNIFSLAHTNNIQDLDDFNLVLVTPLQDLQALMITNRELFNSKLNSWGDAIEALTLFLQNKYDQNQIQPNTESDVGGELLNIILRDFGLTVYQFNEETERWFKP